MACNKKNRKFDLVMLKDTSVIPVLHKKLSITMMELYKVLQMIPEGESLLNKKNCSQV